jgi:hypothetical protein
MSKWEFARIVLLALVLSTVIMGGLLVVAVVADRSWVAPKP